MVLFKQVNEDEIIGHGMKYDPISTLLVLIKAKANINLKCNSKKTPLHYACIRGSTISALTLINNGADCNALDYSETTPYGYALKNNHEDLCIFLIQQNQLIDIPINSIVMNPDHQCNQIMSLQNFANSPKMDELFAQKAELDNLPNFEKLEEGYCKLEAYSPFYYAIKNNMQGNIYLLLQKGFSQFNALAESIMQGKLNLFISLLDVVKENEVQEQRTKDGKNLFHILAEHVSSSMADRELIDEVFGLIRKFKVDKYEKDEQERIPLHYSFMNGNMYIASKFLDGLDAEQKIDLLNTTDKHNVTVYGMLFYKLSKNEKIQQPLTQEVLNLIGLNTLKLNPFVRFQKQYFPYSHLSFVFEDQEMIHPLILYNEVLGVNDKQVVE
jgi:ankyrin repeat protein